MKILHIASVINDIFAGVNNSVVQRVKAQSLFNDVYFLNLNNQQIEGAINQVFIKGDLMGGFSKIVNTLKPDIVVFNEVYRPAYLKIYHILIDLGIKYIVVPHGELSKRSQKKKFLKKKLANLLFFSSFVKKAQSVQFLSKNEQKNSIFNRKSFVSPNGIYDSVIKKNNFKSIKKIVYIGRLEIKIKGIDLLLKAISICSHKMRETGSKLEIYGPDYKNRKKSVTKLIKKYSITDLVEVKDKIYGKEKISVLLESDLFIQTSRTEGLPMGIIEALNIGLPCLVTEGTSLASEIKEFNAGFSSKTSSASIAEHILDALDTNAGDLSMKSNNAITLTKSLFNWETICQNETRLYQKLIKE